MRGPDGAVVGTGFSPVVTVATAAAGVAGPSHPRSRRRLAGASRGRSGSCERWVLGAFRACKKIGDAKYRVKTKRANADREVRGGDPDYSTRGGRAVAMDPSTAFDSHEERGGGQERQCRSWSDGYGRGATVAGGAAASLFSEWRPAEGDGGSSHQVGVGNAEPVPTAAGEAAPCAAPDGHANSDGSGALPPGFDGGVEQRDGGDGAGAAAGCALDAAAQTGTWDCGDGPGLPVGGAEPTEGDLGQVDGAPGSLSRHGSPGPVVPSHCEGDTTAIGGARPDGSLGGISGERPVQGHDDTTTGPASGAHDERVLLSPCGAACAGGGAASATQHCFHDGDGVLGALPGDDDAGHHDGSLRVRLEAEARPSPSGLDVPAGDEAAVGALPVPSGAGGGEAPSGVTDSRLLEGAQGADDELPFFSPVDGEPPSPTEPEELVLEAATVHDAVDEGATAHGRGPHLLAGADGGQDGGGLADGTQSFGADASGSPSCAGATGAGALPHGVVSPPATTAFGSGIGLAPTSGAGDNANIAHSVLLDSDSDSGLGGSDSAAIAANDVAASEGPGDVPSPPGLAGARQ